MWSAVENISAQWPQFMELINAIFVLKLEVFCVKKRKNLGKISVAGAKLERGARRSDLAWFSPLVTAPFFFGRAKKWPCFVEVSKR